MFPNSTTRPQSKFNARSLYQNAGSRPIEKDHYSRDAQINSELQSFLSLSARPDNNSPSNHSPFLVPPSKCRQQTNEIQSYMGSNNKEAGSYQHPQVSNVWSSQRAKHNIKVISVGGDSAVKQDKTPPVSIRVPNSDVFNKKGEVCTHKTMIPVHDNASISRNNDRQSVLVSKIDSVRDNMRQELIRCRNTEEANRIIVEKLDWFDETLRKVTESYEQLWSYLKEIERAFEQQFEALLAQFEKDHGRIGENIQKGQEQQQHTNLYRKNEGIKKNFGVGRERETNALQKRPNPWENDTKIPQAAPRKSLKLTTTGPKLCERFIVNQNYLIVRKQEMDIEQQRKIVTTKVPNKTKAE